MTERSTSSLPQALTSLALGREEPFRQRRAEQITALVAAALFMENLDSTVIVPALPQMARSFGTNPVGLNIGVTAYTLILAVFIPISGWMADRFGARRRDCDIHRRLCTVRVQPRAMELHRLPSPARRRRRHDDAGGKTSTRNQS